VGCEFKLAGAEKAVPNLFGGCSNDRASLFRACPASVIEEPTGQTASPRCARCRHGTRGMN